MVAMKVNLTSFSPFDLWSRLSRDVAIHECHEGLFLASSFPILSVSESLSLVRLLRALNLCGSRISLTVKEVTACRASCTDSSSEAERSCGSSDWLLGLPWLLLSMRELIEKRSLPCILLKTQFSSVLPKDPSQTLSYVKAAAAHRVTRLRGSLPGLD